MAEETVRSINPAFSIHDFRVVPAPSGKTLLFDVSVPYAFPGTEEELTKRIESLFTGDCCAKVTIDRSEPNP